MKLSENQRKNVCKNYSCKSKNYTEYSNENCRKGNFIEITEVFSRKGSTANRKYSKNEGYPGNAEKKNR